MDKYYSNCVVKFAGIENIHKMRESEAKLRNLCFTEPHDVIAKKIDSTKWLRTLYILSFLLLSQEHISMILSGACEVAQSLESGFSVVVHCSDGWDRTSQVSSANVISLSSGQLTSIALLILDPFYRTLDGFMILIEKEWISFGHMFCTRLGHVPSSQKQPERSPVFPQFVDCVWQMMRHLKVILSNNQISRKKNAFEFNDRFLIAILERCYTCMYGTFMFDSEYERKTKMAPKVTLSLWDSILAERAIYINQDFKSELVSFSNMKGFSLALWDAYYLRWKNFHEGGPGVSFSVLWKETPKWFQV